MSYPNDEVTYKPLGGLHILIDIAAEQTGLLPGALYEFVAHGGAAVCRWDTTAAVAGDAGFTFCVTPGVPVRVRCPILNTAGLLNVIQANADSAAAASLTLSIIEPD